MAMEELPKQYQDFFNTGMMNDALKAEQEAMQSTVNAEAEKAAQDAKAVADAAAAQKAVQDASAAEEAAKAAVETPKAPEANPYLERLLQNQAEQVKRLNEELETLKKGQEAAKVEPAPDPSTDPLGYMTHQVKTLSAQIEAMKNGQVEAAQTAQSEKAQQQFFEALNSSINAFKATKPDYNDAYQHLIKTRTQDYVDMGYTSHEAKALMGQEEMRIAQQSLSTGKNPGELVYNLAKKYGYVSKETPKEDNKLDAIKKGQEAAKDTQREAAPAERATISSLKDMSDADLNKAVQEDWDKLFGRTKSIFG